MARRNFLIRAEPGALEQTALRRAATRMEEALVAAGADAPRFAFAPQGDAAPDDGAPREIVVLSLAQDIEPLAQAWDQTQARLRAEIPAGAKAHEFFYLTTVFRCVRDEAPELAAARRTRIRRLNLLAAELSQETGAFVVDLDRALADVGGRALDADWRLESPFAVEAAARRLAMAFLSGACDDLFPATTLEAALAHLQALPPPWPSEGPARAVPVGLNTLSMRVGGFTQTVQTFGETDGQAALYLRALLSGAIGPRDALARLNAAVARRGLRQCAMLVFGGAARLAVRRLRPNGSARGGRP